MDAETSNQSGDPSRVLIVDDEKGIRELFATILSGALASVALDEASNGAEAVAQFRKHRHRVLIMDLNMPVMDGLTAFCEISRMFAHESLEMPSVVFCTGYAPSDAIRKSCVSPAGIFYSPRP